MNFFWTLFLGVFWSVSLQAQLDVSDRAIRIEAATQSGVSSGLDRSPLQFQNRKGGLTQGDGQSGFEIKKQMNSAGLTTDVDREGALKNADLKTYHTKIAPKAFQEGGQLDRNRIGKDEYLGDFETTSKTLHVFYKDSQTIDGDLIRIYNEDEVVLDKAFLAARFGKLTIDLVPGFNRIDIQALNEGEGAPNTGHFVLRHGDGELIHDGEWFLSSGNKASFIVLRK